MQFNKNIPPEIKGLIEKTAHRGTTLNIDPISRAYIIVGGTLDKHNNSFFKIKIKGVLNGLMGFSDSEISRAEHKLKDTGWIVSGKGRKWLTLSKVAWAYWKEIAESIDDWGEVVDAILKGAEDVQYPDTDAPFGLIRKLTRKVGRDLIIYVYDGERDRINYAIDAIKQMVGGYRQIYLLHSPETTDKFLSELKSRTDRIELSVRGVEMIEVEPWREWDFRTVAKIAKHERRHLDIIFSAMPRAAVIYLYKNLNYPEMLCEQTWYYNRAKKYGRYGDVSDVEHSGEKIDGGRLVVFGENFTTRIEIIPFYELLNDRKLLIGEPSATQIGNNYPIDIRTNRMVQHLKIADSCTFAVDYTSAYDVCNKLKYNDPKTIYVSGNRVIALGIAMYYVDRLRNELQPPHLVYPHIKSKEYSTGSLSELIPVLHCNGTVFEPNVLMHYG